MQPLHMRIATIAIGIALLFGIFWILRPQHGGDTTSTGSVTGMALVAEAREPRGEVTRIRSGQEEAITDGMDLASGDLIRTQQGSVSLEFFAGSRVALDQHTQLRIDTADINANNQRDQRVEVTVLAGRAWNRVLKLLEVHSSFKAHGGNITATVRGTAFALTSHPGVAGSDAALDLFDGQLGITGSAEGLLEAGFTFTEGMNAGQPFYAHVLPTSDQVRNDHWIRDQLKEDRAFIERIEALRQRLQDDTSYELVGEEAGAFTLHEGMAHSSFQGVEVRPGKPFVALAAGELLTLDAIAHFYENGQTRQDDITDRATWQLSDTSLATLDPKGVLIAKEGNGAVIVTARWSDGTHEHSNAIVVPIGNALPPTIETTIETDTSLIISP